MRIATSLFTFVLAAAITVTAQDQLTRQLLIRGSNTNPNNVGIITVGALGAPVTFTLPSYSGTPLVLNGALVANRALRVNASAEVEGVELTNGQFLIGSTGAMPVAGTITGTANQISVATGAGSITLSLPQNIHSAATPTFAGLTLSGVTADAAATSFLVLDAGGVVRFRTLTSGVWLTTGNTIGSGTDGVDNVLGTLSGSTVAPVNIIANGQRVSRFVPAAAATDAPTLIHGFSGNTVAGVGGAVLAGGRSGSINTVDADFGVVAGGYGNGVTQGADRGAVVGGSSNTIFGSGSRSAIIGGESNTINQGANRGGILAGYQNIIRGSAQLAGIVAGDANRIDDGASRAVIAGGLSNAVYGSAADAGVFAGVGHQVYEGANRSVVLGGETSQIRQGGSHSAILSGIRNVIRAGFSAIMAGGDHVISGSATASGIVAGDQNSIIDGASRSVVLGGLLNSISLGGARAAIVAGDNNGVRAEQAVVVGGTTNLIDAGSSRSFVAGGNTNVINGASLSSAVVGGDVHTLGSADNTGVFAGSGHTVSSPVTRTTNSALVGGNSNTISSGQSSVVLGGRNNQLRQGSSYSSVVGGEDNDMNASVNSAIIGGANNLVFANGRSAIIAGQQNEVRSNNAVIIGGGSSVINVAGSRSVVLGGTAVTINSANTLAFHDGTTNAATVSTANTAFFGNVNVWIGNNNGTAQANASQLRFYSPANAATGDFPATGQRFTAIRASSSQTAADITYTLPASTTPTTTIESGLLQTTAGGDLSWVDVTMTSARKAYVESVGAIALNATHHVVVITAAGNATLPTAAAAGTGRTYVVKNLSGGAINIEVAGGDQIDATAAGTPLNLADGAVATLISNGGTRWVRLD